MRPFSLMSATLVAGAIFAGSAVAGDGSKRVVTAKYADKTLYLQTNLAHYDGGVDWANFLGTGTFFPVGTAVRLKGARGDEFTLELVDSGVSVEVDCDEVRPSMEVVAERMLGTSAPPLDDFTDAEREAIAAARVEPGMSRRAVFVSLGYPPYFFKSVRVDRKMIANTDVEKDEELVWVKNDFNVIAVQFEGDKVVSVGNE